MGDQWDYSRPAFVERWAEEEGEGREEERRNLSTLKSNIWGKITKSSNNCQPYKTTEEKQKEEEEKEEEEEEEKNTRT